MAHHSRSNSFPSAPHPIVSQVQEHLLRLKDSEATSSLTTSSSICHRLDGLQDLQESTDKLLQLTITQKECSNKQVNELLDGSLRLLDICTTVKDCLLQSKDNMHELQSVIRRRRDAKTGFTVEGGNYLAYRKKMKKAFAKSLANLKAIKNEFTVSSSLNKEEKDTFSILKEAEAVTVSSLESLLLFITASKGQLNQKRWSAISKLVKPKRISCDDSEKSDINEFKKVDSVLQFLISSQASSSMENFQSHMQNLEMCIEDIQVGVEHLSRQLIRNRVSLLNILNH